MRFIIKKKAVCDLCGSEMVCCGAGSRGFFFECKKCGHTEEVEEDELKELQNKEVLKNS